MSNVSIIHRVVQYLYETVHRLYIFHTDPLRLIIGDEDLAANSVLALQARALSQAVVLLSCLENNVRELWAIVQEAKKTVLTARVLIVEESLEVRGPILWSRVSTSLARSGHVPQVILKHTLASPENILLRWLVHKLLDLVRCVREIIDREYGVLRTFLDDVRIVRLIGYEMLSHRTALLEQLLIKLARDPFIKSIVVAKALPEDTIQRLLTAIRKSAWKPRWVSRLLTLADKVRYTELNLQKLRDLLRLRLFSADRKSMLLCIRFLVWRLYELYVLYIIIRALRTWFRNRAVVKVTDREFLFEIRDGERLRIAVFYNVKPVEKSVSSVLVTGQVANLLGRTIHDKSLLMSACGRPDIVLKVDNDVIVCEVKFSRSASYLTQARFKVLAYMREYHAKTGILVYPGLGIRQVALDEEDVETIRLLEYASREGGLKLKLADTACLYIVPVVPLPEKESENVNIVQKILGEVLENICRAPLANL